jgi:hypothetical protein
MSTTTYEADRNERTMTFQNQEKRNANHTVNSELRDASLPIRPEICPCFSVSAARPYFDAVMGRTSGYLVPAWYGILPPFFLSEMTTLYGFRMYFLQAF